MIPAPASRPPAALGWLLLTPAVLALVVSLVVPSVQTILLSMRSGRLLLRADGGEFIGLAAYAQLLGGPVFWRALLFSVLFTLVPLLVAVAFAPVLAVSLDRGGAGVRRAGRVVLTLAVITFSPMAVVAAWLGAMRGASTLAVFLRGLLGDSAALLLPPAIGAMTFGVVIATATLAYLPALRGERPLPATAVMAAVVALTLLAVGLQAYTFSGALSRRGPTGTETLGALMVSEGFMIGRLGSAAAIATTTGVLAGILGLVVVLLVVLTGLRIHVATGTTPATPAGRLAGILALVLVTLAGLALAAPWLLALSGTAEPAPATLGTHVRTWLPALIGALVSVGVAYLGALGIGGLRPLGRRSEWLLLPFAPWLLVGTGPLSIAGWSFVRDLGLVGTFAAVIPPLLVSVPALLVLTLVCRSLAQNARTGFLRGVVVPSLPMAGVLAGAVTLVNAQDGLWPTLVSRETESGPAVVMLRASLGAYRGGGPDVGLMTPLPVILVALAAAVAAQLLYLDRLAISVGK
ncbi:hypothetical protein [Nonomuraea typhae]|uniref:hypothetical protein n=1 Tax=Nonomuraea typhae TaxID=2603600 RepID=UPI0012F90EC7|nr:hypothetical protein [Nonomuraea typhae]